LLDHVVVRILIPSSTISQINHVCCEEVFRFVENNVEKDFAGLLGQVDHIQLEFLRSSRWAADGDKIIDRFGTDYVLIPSPRNLEIWSILS
jgi:hypothetical protein